MVIKYLLIITTFFFIEIQCKSIRNMNILNEAIVKSSNPQN